MFLSATACQSNKREHAATPVALNYMSSPAMDSAAEPYLVADKDKNVYLSWVEEKGDSGVLRFSKWTNGEWSDPALIAAGNTWFVNWADYPMIATDGSGNFMAHILDRSGPGKFSYDVKVLTSADSGNTWQSPFVLHDDGKEAEHGFVSFLPYQDKFLVTWLDGRNTVSGSMEGMSHEGHHGAMTLRAAILDHSGKKSGEWELDAKTCDCCQTTAALTDSGPVVIYRDRSDEEIRDMYIVRLVNGNWTSPRPVYRDNWKINGCPVNGPRAAAHGNDLAVAWYSAPEDSAKVQVIFSADGGATFGKPVRVDEGNTIGRVDVVMLANHSVVVSWMEGGTIKARTISQDGKKGEPITVFDSSSARSSGFPQMEASENELIFAWTDDHEQAVRVASLALSSFE